MTNKFSAKCITALVQDRQGQLWIGTGGEGLYCLAGEGVRSIERADGLAGDFVRTLFLDAEGVLWIGTSSGLSRIKHGQVASLSTQQGLWDDVISQILEDDSGHLWFGCNRGIFQVNKSELNDVIEGRLTKVNPRIFRKGKVWKTWNALADSAQLDCEHVMAGCGFPR